MKIVVSVYVANRLLPQHNIRAANKMRTSSITVTKETGKTGKIYILLQSAQNKVGTKYLISDIDDILTRFIKQGTLTIRFAAPPHDLYIKGDALLLQNFVKLVKLAQQNNPVAIPLLSSSCTPFSTKTVRKPVTKLAVEQKQDYPVLEGFPRTLEVLKICGIQQSRFDERILLLRMLKVLDLSDNNLSTLPPLDSLSNLHTLVLAKNNLGSSSSDWLWLSGESLRKNLRELDLSNNSSLISDWGCCLPSTSLHDCLCVLPEEVYNLLSLVTLNVSNNQLTHLAFRIAKLSFLRFNHAWLAKYVSMACVPAIKQLYAGGTALPYNTFFNVSHNNLHSLPCTIRNMKLLEIDVSENNLAKKEVNETIKCNYRITSLFHVSAQRVLEYRLPYSSANLPLSIVRFLDEAGYCWCGRAVFNSYFRCFPYFPLAHVPTVRGESFVPLEMYACSGKCYSGLERARLLT